MPWSPVPKMPGIVSKLYENYKKEFSINVLRKTIILDTGIYTDTSVAKVIKLMINLDYILEVPDMPNIFTYGDRAIDVLKQGHNVRELLAYVNSINNEEEKSLDKYVVEKGR